MFLGLLRRKRLHLGSICLAAWLFSCAGVTASTGYVIEGSIFFRVEPNQESLPIPTNLPAELQLPFIAKVHDKAWNIEIEYPNGIREIAGSDGNDVYSVLKNKSGIINARVASGTNPERLVFHHTFFVWLAMASGDFLKTNSTPTLPPWLLVDTNPAVVFKYEVESDWQPPHLPRSFIITEGRLNLPTTSSGAAASRPLSAANHVAVGDYRAAAWTNVASMRLPERFEFKRYWPTGFPSNSGPQRLHFETYSGFASNAFAITEAVERPAMSSGTTVYDTRFARLELGVESVAYVATNAVWLAQDDPHLQRAAQLAYEAAARSQRINKWESVIGNILKLGIFPVISILVAVVVWRLNRARAQTKNT